MCSIVSDLELETECKSEIVLAILQTCKPFFSTSFFVLFSPSILFPCPFHVKPVSHLVGALLLEADIRNQTHVPCIVGTAADPATGDQLNVGFFNLQGGLMSFFTNRMT